MKETQRVILAGLYGAAVPSVAAICLGSAMLVPFWDLLASQIGMATIWGLSAGLLTMWLWSQHLRLVACAVGFWGYICGYATTLYLMNSNYQRFFPYSSFGKTQSQWLLIFTALAAGILAQILTLCVLLVL